ncbi:hypothetical protein QVD17_24969 [Tagetes erecta]|uniref:BHLH domain-containing protein n=1 Tax=Tagetes erecta TaxID=13708 RepID=A0AAD8NV17_TARER|nr:hypothetical protein QVD17_24969 [Tagetes erecta]
MITRLVALTQGVKLTPKTLDASSFSSSSNAFTISFGEQNNPKDNIHTFNDSCGVESFGTRKVKTSLARTPVRVQEHVLAERKRREKLNLNLISLSAILPNLKKMDKASVLEDAANHIRELQDRVKELEGLSNTNTKDAKECIIAFNRSTIKGDDANDSSSNETYSNDFRTSVACNSSAEIEVRMLGSSVLVRVQSKKNYSLLEKVLNKMQKLGLSIISSSAMPFADATTIIVVVAHYKPTLH